MVKRLEAEVWSQNNCAGCGLCVAVCSKQVLRWDGEDHPVLEKRPKVVGFTKGNLDSCSFCQKFCEEACPRLERWSPLETQATLSVKARGPVKSGAPNDIIRAILTAGRSAGLIDGVAMLDLDPWTLEPLARIATTVEDIVDTVGPQYLWAPVFDVLNEAVFRWKMENLAVVGAPCASEAIRKLRDSTNPRLKPYQSSLRLRISIFCTGMYQPELVDEVLIRRMGLHRDQIKRLEVSPDRKWLHAVLWDGSKHSIPRQLAEEYTRPGCATCNDYLGDSADLAVGTLGAPEGASTLIVRSQAGDVFARNAIQMNLLETGPAVDQEALTASRQEKGRRAAAQDLMDLKLLMLDALADPLQHNEAVRQFIRLYRTPARVNEPDRPQNGCTGC